VSECDSDLPSLARNWCVAQGTMQLSENSS